MTELPAVCLVGSRHHGCEWIRVKKNVTFKKGRLKTGDFGSVLFSFSLFTFEEEVGLSASTLSILTNIPI